MSQLDIQTNLKFTDYLDFTLNLYNGTVSPFKKNNQYSCGTSVGSNYPRQIFKYIPNGILFRLSTKSSGINIFTQSKHAYELTLKKNSGYKTKLVSKTIDETSNLRNKGKNWLRKILWFTPPYDMAVTNNLQWINE